VEKKAVAAEAALVPLSGKRERTKASNRQAILDAARQVFAELGYGAASVRDIIRGTKLASGTFYNYFSSKEEVFRALLDDTALQVRPRLREARLDAANFEAFIRGTFETFYDYLVSDRATYAMLRRNTGTLRVRMDTPEIVAGFDELKRDIKDGMARGLIPNVDPDYLTSAFVGVAFEVGDRMLHRDPPDPKGAAAFASALMLGGISALPRLEGVPAKREP